MLTCTGVFLARNGKAKQELGLAGTMGAGGVLGCCSPSLFPLLASLLCSSLAEQQTLHLRLVFTCLFLPSVLLLSLRPCISHQRGGGEQLQLLCGKTFRLWCSARDGAGWLMHHIPVCRRSSKPTLSSSTLDAFPAFESTAPQPAFSA